MSVTFNGLASGLDTGALIDQLVAVERSAADKLTSRQSDLNTQKSIVGSLSSALSGLATAVRGLDLMSEVQPLTAVVSDSHVAVAVSAGAAAATHDLRVNALATAQVTGSKSFASSGPGVLGNGGVNITVGGVTKSVSWTNADSLADIATRITDANAGVSAGVVFDGSAYRIVVTADQTGVANAATFQDTGSKSNRLDLASAGNVIRPAADASLVIDGLAITRSTNVITDALPGATLTLNSAHAASDPDTKVEVKLDTKALTDKLKAVVTAYNAVNSALHVQLDYTGTTKGTNTLFGDSTLRQLQGSLGTIMSNAYGGSSLSVLGITRDKTGAMTLDETKLASALGADASAVAKIFVTNGFAGTVSTLADQYTQAGGILATKTDGLTGRHKALQEQIDRINRNADSLQARLERQFGALEDAMSQLQNQMGYLTGLFAK